MFYRQLEILRLFSIMVLEHLFKMSIVALLIGIFLSAFDKSPYIPILCLGLGYSLPIFFDAVVYYRKFERNFNALNNRNKPEC